MIYRLANSQQTRNSIPRELEKYFDGPVYEVHYPCLIGTDQGFTHWRCLRFRERFLKEGVMLDEFRYEQKPYDYSILIDPLNLFYILSNLCVEITMIGCNSLEQLKNTVQLLKEKPDYKPKNMYEYVYDYLLYILNLLNLNKLEPMEILANGGINTIIYLLPKSDILSNFVLQIIQELSAVLSLSIEKRIIYFTLLESLRYHYRVFPPEEDSSKTSIKSILRFVSTNGRLLDELYNKLQLLLK
jgi:hypothetical protein